MSILNMNLNTDIVAQIEDRGTMQIDDHSSQKPAIKSRFQ